MIWADVEDGTYCADRGHCTCWYYHPDRPCCTCGDAALLRQATVEPCNCDECSTRPVVGLPTS